MSKFPVQRINGLPSNHLIREATRGEFELGSYLHDAGTGAAAGAAAGAVAGLPTGGVLSGPGALIGGVGGAVWGAGSKAVDDIAYKFYGDDGKAAWQAGDLEDEMNKLAGFFRKYDQQAAAQLAQLGAMYKNFIDIYVKKKDDEDLRKIYNQNIFNPQSEGYTPNPFAAQASPVQASKRFRKTASGDNLGSDMAGAVPAGIAEGLVGNSKRMQQYPGASGFAPFHGLPVKGVPAGEALKNLGKGGFKAVKGLGVGLLAENAADWLLNTAGYYMTGGEASAILGHIGEIAKIIQIVNGLTNNDEKVVSAGNVVFTYMKALDEQVKQIQSAKQNPLPGPVNPNAPQQQSQVAPTQSTLTPSVTPQQGTSGEALVNSMTVATVGKFIRIKHA